MKWIALIGSAILAMIILGFRNLKIRERKLSDTEVNFDPPAPGAMRLVHTGDGQRNDYPSGDFCVTERLQWENRENKDIVRIPRQKIRTFPLITGFWAAGRYYRSHWDLRVQGSGHWRKDIYGRDVLVLVERFPCFDSFDAMYENRYTRWYFLCEKGKLTRVYFKDETVSVQVTEDVQDLEYKLWEDFQQLGYHV